MTEEQRFAELAFKLKARPPAERNKILAGLSQPELDGFLVWLQTDSGLISGIYAQAVAISMS